MESASKYATPGSTLRSLSRQLEAEKRTPAFGLSAFRPSAPSMSTVPDPEAQLLRQQMDQITSDFKYNLKLLHDRDAELAKLESQVATLRSEASSSASALAEARRALAERDAQARAQASNLAAAEARAREAEDLRARLRASEEEGAERERGLAAVVARFESALGTLGSLERRYEALASGDAQRAQRVAAAEAALRDEAEAGACLRERCARLEAEAARHREESAAAALEAERARSAAAAAQALLDTARLSLEGCRRDAQAWALDRADLERAAREEAARAEELARDVALAVSRAAAAEELASSTAAQLDQERALHAQLLAGKEAEARGEAERAARQYQAEANKARAALERTEAARQSAARQLDLARMQLDRLRGAGPRGPPGGRRGGAAQGRFDDEGDGDVFDALHDGPAQRRGAARAASPPGHREGRIRAVHHPPEWGDEGRGRRADRPMPGGGRGPLGRDIPGVHHKRPPAGEELRLGTRVSDADDPLATVRQQVQAAKQYLRQVADANAAVPGRP
ncbi:hypothetical protein ACKKBF_B10955 [Auxenochlorella protothecoides x Auxenochlorella symbiontica]|uniref:Uncharacterized protein n=1 Tax=Auxenochlorella protothecoides TaxID=3075 RepID=A0A1D1ZYK6_AUXPR